MSSLPEEEGDLLEGDGGSKVLDEVAATVDETAVGAVNLADLGFGCDDPFQPRTEVRHET